MNNPPEAYVGIDLAFAKRKPLPVVVCVHRNGRLEPLLLRTADAPLPPRGQGNVKTLDSAVLAGFAEETVQYLRAVENHCGVSIVRVGIDAPSDPRPDDVARREAERVLDGHRIHCFTTPGVQQFQMIRSKVETHLAEGVLFLGCRTQISFGCLSVLNCSGGYGWSGSAWKSFLKPPSRY